MEYPFKNLQPLDETTARDGYYRDWTHIDSDTFHQISELVKFIREKGYGADTREAIAQALERVYHDALISGNANMEVSMARKHFRDLASRLDASDDKLTSTTAQLAQKITKDRGEVSSSDLSQEVKEQMTGGSVAVVGENSVLKENVVDGQIEIEKASDSLKKLLHGEIINASQLDLEVGSLSTFDGTDAPGDNRLRSRFIEAPVSISIKDSKNYSFRCAEYHDRVFESMTDWMADDYIVSDNTDEVRILIRKNDNTPIEEGNDIGNQVNLHYKTIKNNDLADRTIEGLKLQRKSITPVETDFFNISTNLFDFNDIETGKTVDPTAGAIIESAIDQFVSNKITVGGGENIVIVGSPLGSLGFSFWNGEDFISRVVVTGQTMPLVTPLHTTHIIVYGSIHYVDDVQINLGDEVLPYEKGYQPFLKPEFINRSLGFNDNDIIFAPVEIGNNYILPDGIYEYPTITEVYGRYDTLISQNAQYISKSILGKDTTGNYDIFKLNLNEKEYFNTNNPNSQLHGKKPKIIIIAGIHGHEQAGVLSTYYMIEALCNSWKTDERLEYLRFNVELEVIPIVYPDGYVTDSYKNVTGVNLQTNFPYNWGAYPDPSSHVYGGAEPASEVEVGYIMDLINENLDSLLFIDMHSAEWTVDFQEGIDSAFYFLQSPDKFYNQRLDQATKYTIESLSRLMKKNYPIEGTNLLSRIQWREGSGTADAYASSKGVTSTVLEVPEWMPYDAENHFSSDTLKFGAEVLINYLLNVLRAYKQK